MSLELKNIDISNAIDLLRKRGCSFNVNDEQANFCISVVDGEITHGVIVMIVDGITCSLGHLYTDGTALVGSILYGAAWRAAKALGYKQITI